MNDRSVETVVGMLAVLKAGAVYVPLDPALPGDRLRFMAEDRLRSNGFDRKFLYRAGASAASADSYTGHRF